VSVSLEGHDIACTHSATFCTTEEVSAGQIDQHTTRPTAASATRAVLHEVRAFHPALLPHEALWLPHVLRLWFHLAGLPHEDVLRLIPISQPPGEFPLGT